MTDSSASATGKPAPTSHTPEPWTWGMLYVTKPDPTNPRRDDAGYLRIAMHPSGETQPERGEWEANARRIVACVNACAGVPDIMLASGLFKDTCADVTKIASHAAELERQRDTLVEVLGALQASVDQLIYRHRSIRRS